LSSKQEKKRGKQAKAQNFVAVADVNAVFFGLRVSFKASGKCRLACKSFNLARHHVR
jgi:hypothetical protein